MSCFVEFACTEDRSVRMLSIADAILALSPSNSDLATAPMEAWLIKSVAFKPTFIPVSRTPDIIILSTKIFILAASTCSASGSFGSTLNGFSSVDVSVSEPNAMPSSPPEYFKSCLVGSYAFSTTGWPSFIHLSVLDRGDINRLIKRSPPSVAASTANFPVKKEAANPAPSPTTASTLEKPDELRGMVLDQSKNPVSKPTLSAAMSPSAATTSIVFVALSAIWLSRNVPSLTPASRVAW